MITASGIELRAGARILIESASFRIAKGDRIGLVGRNGAGKTTLTKVLAGEGIPAAGTVTRSGEVGYLPQDPRTGDLDVLARDRILSARGLDVLIRKMRENEQRIANGEGATREKAMKQYERQETEFLTKGGYAAEAEAATIAAALNLPDRVLGQPLHTLSGGQRRRIELARILFSDADTLLLDEPTNHLDADSIVWLRDYLKTYRGGFIVISHDVDLVETVVNKVFYLDANRAQIDVYNMGWKLYQQQREADEKRRKRERAERREEGRRAATRRPTRCAPRPPRPSPRRTWPSAPTGCSSGLEAVRVSDKVAKLRFPEPAPCGKTPLMAEGLSKSYGSLEIFTDVDLAIDKGSRVVILGLNGAGKTTLLRLLGGRREARHRRGHPGPRPQARLLRPGARDPRPRAHGPGEHALRRPRPGPGRGPQDARLVPVLRRRRRQARRRPLRRREDPAGARHPGGLLRERAAARRAHQQPRPGQPRGDPRRAAHLQGRRRPRHPRRGRRRGAPAGADHPAARTASRTCGAPDYADLVALA